METIVARLIDQGVLGIVVLALAVAIVALWRRVEALQSERVRDLKELAGAYHEAVEENTRTLSRLLEEG